MKKPARGGRFSHPEIPGRSGVEFRQRVPDPLPGVAVSDAAGDEPVRGLEAAHGFGGERAEVAVDAQLGLGAEAVEGGLQGLGGVVVGAGDAEDLLGLLAVRASRSALAVCGLVAGGRPAVDRAAGFATASSSSARPSRSREGWRDPPSTMQAAMVPRPASQAGRDRAAAAGPKRWPSLAYWPSCVYWNTPRPSVRSVRSSSGRRSPPASESWRFRRRRLRPGK